MLAELLNRLLNKPDDWALIQEFRKKTHETFTFLLLCDPLVVRCCGAIACTNALSACFDKRIERAVYFDKHDEMRHFDSRMESRFEFELLWDRQRV